MAVDPLFYIPHVIYFTLGAILFGFFAQALRAEIDQRGWMISPRSLWISCMCCSSFGFLVVQLDPVGALGLFSEPWQIFLRQTDGTMLLVSFCSAIYMYVIVSYTKYKAKVPRVFAGVWAASNVASLFLVFVSELIGAITNNIFWFGIGMLTVILHELIIFLGMLISVHQVMKLLQDLEAKGSSFQLQRRKLNIVRGVTTVLAVISIANLIFTGNISNQLMGWGQPVPVLKLDNFDFNLVQLDLMCVLAHACLLYILRRPRDDDSRSTSRITERISQLPDISSITVVNSFSV